jgi:hypothetical protein
MVDSVYIALDLMTIDALGGHGKITLQHCYAAPRHNDPPVEGSEKTKPQQRIAVTYTTNQHCVVVYLDHRHSDTTI